MGALISVKHGRARPDWSMGYLHELNAMHAQLDQDFSRMIQNIYFDTRQENYALLAIAAAMGEYEATWYAARKRGLVCAEVLLIRYFITQCEPLDPILIRGGTLVDMIFKRVLERSIEDPRVSAELDKHRKRVYLYLTRYRGEVDGVDHLAYRYAQHIVHIRALTMLARRDFDVASYKYRSETYLDFDEVAMAALDSVIDTVWADKEVTEMSMNDDYRVLMTSVAATNLIAHDHVSTYDDERVESVSMDEVVPYEVSLLRGRKGLSDFATDMGQRIEAMEREFADTMHTVFYCQQRMATRLQNFPLMAISCQMAQIESLLMVDLRRMLMNIKSLIDVQDEKVVRIFEVNPHAVEFMVQHLIGYSIENALTRVLSRRKRLHLALMRYERYEQVRDLAQIQYKRMYDLDYRMRETKGLSEVYMDVVMTTTPEEHLSEIVSDVNELIKRAAQLWTLDVDDMRLLRISLDTAMYNEIKTSFTVSVSKIHRPRADTIEAVTLEDIKMHERQLLGYPEAGI